MISGFSVRRNFVMRNATIQSTRDYRTLCSPRQSGLLADADSTNITVPLVMVHEVGVTARPAKTLHWTVAEGGIR